jgi:hypothetical protein
MGGAGVLATASKLLSYPSRATAWVIKAAKNNVISKSVAKTAGTMVDRVGAIRTTINGKTVAEIVSAGVDRMDVMYQELLRIGKPLDDFGVRVHQRMAEFLSKDIGTFPGEKSLRGYMRATPELVEGEAVAQDMYATLFKDEAGNLDRNAIVSDLEKIADSSEEFHIIATADSPQVEWRLNAGGAIRSESEAIDITLREGLVIPSDVEIAWVPEDFFPPGVNASYIRFKPSQKFIAWNDFYVNGKIRVTVSRRVLNSDEAIVAAIGHELYEINGLREIFASSPNPMKYIDVAKLIEPRLNGTLHQQAWAYADYLVNQMR